MNKGWHSARKIKVVPRSGIVLGAVVLVPGLLAA
jgi:hypothetical protein